MLCCGTLLLQFKLVSLVFFSWLGPLCSLSDNSGPSQRQVELKSLFISIGLSQTSPNKLSYSRAEPEPANSAVGSSSAASLLGEPRDALIHFSCPLKASSHKRQSCSQGPGKNRKFSHCDGKHCQELKRYSGASDTRVQAQIR